VSATSSILLIDDDRDIRETLGELLTMIGYHVTLACHGREALDILEGGASPDLILLDLMMPVMDGYEFREAQRKLPGGSEIPVFVMSASPIEGQDGLDAARIFRKPFDLDELFEALAER
jgi:CheY-like chemotaxis protein